MLSRITIAGMHAVHAVRAVETALGALDGVARCDVRRGEAEIEHGDELSEEEIRAAIEVAGYTVLGVVRERRRLPLV